MFEFLRPIEIVVAWIMVQFHTWLTAIGMSATGGWTWALSIVGLVVVIRILLIPLFVKQIKASRGLQLIQPEMKKIQAKYKGKTDQASRQALTQETMALYKREGTNPFASCLPILLQSPIFFALFQVLNNLTRIADGTREPLGAMTQELAAQAEASTLFGARLSSTFLNSGDDIAVKILTVVLIILMSATTFTTQKQLMTKNMPAAALDNPFARQQKVLLYALPVIFAVSGVNFPIGVLLYWLTTNLWSMGQQFYTIRRMPAPGSTAEKALLERKARKARAKGLPVDDDADGTDGSADDAPAGGQRVQPKRKDRKRKGLPAAGSSPPVDLEKPAPAPPGKAGKATAKPAAKPASGGAGAKGKRKGKRQPGRPQQTPTT
ncbi:MAG TPA: membrane protein insertase YidC [Actinomycetales bacterium]|nr:membrane protein insertase YidC [Actinomycetales bacterium]